jgi:2-hydroxy-6-oxonona-2,4-dienedioate hydrolase
MNVRIVDVNGVRTRYLFEGSGYPLVLVHGAGLSGDSWMRNIDALAQDFFVVAPDTLGHGFTESGDYVEGPPHPHIVDHLIALIDILGIDRLAIAGSSFGALISALVYFKLPRRVEKLIVVSSGSMFNTEDDLRTGLPKAYRNGLSAYTNPSLENCRRRLANIFYDAAKVPEEMMLVQMTSYALPGALEAYGRRMRGMMDLEASRPYRILDRVEEITIPTLVLWGRQDPRGIFARALDAVKRLPDGRLVAFDKCGHHPHLEHPREFNELVRQFVRGEPLAVAAEQVQIVG